VMGLNCNDCGIDTIAQEHSEYYMIHKALWVQAMSTPSAYICLGCLIGTACTDDCDGHGFLGIGCLEQRIGRELTLF
jgi:hypothetical protein